MPKGTVKMETISKQRIEKYKYETKDERERHVQEMESNGWECTGRVKQSDSFDGEYYWFGEFYKYEN